MEWKILSMYLLLLSVFLIQQVSSQDLPSCAGRCGEGYSRDATCNCDYKCQHYMECCPDFKKVCTMELSCKGRCFESFARGRECDCDSDCTKYGKCCPDYENFCGKVHNPTSPPSSKTAPPPPGASQTIKSTTKRSPKAPNKKMTKKVIESEEITEEHSVSENQESSSSSSSSSTIRKINSSKNSAANKELKKKPKVTDNKKERTPKKKPTPEPPVVDEAGSGLDNGDKLTPTPDIPTTQRNRVTTSPKITTGKPINPKPSLPPNSDISKETPSTPNKEATVATKEAFLTNKETSSGTKEKTSTKETRNAEKTPPKDFVPTSKAPVKSTPEAETTTKSPAPTTTKEPTPTTLKKPVPTTPKKPAPTTKGPTPTTPKKPAPTTPKEPIPTTTKEPAPTTKEPTPTTPKEPAPTTPKEPTPTTPKKPAPTTPKEPAPTTPKEPAPTTPKEPTPTTPKKPAPTTPKKPAPTTPKEPAPTAPKEPVPTAPKEPAPTAPKEPTPKVPKKPAPASLETPAPTISEASTTTTTMEPPTTPKNPAESIPEFPAEPTPKALENSPFTTEETVNKPEETTAVPKDTATNPEVSTSKPRKPTKAPKRPTSTKKPKIPKVRKPKTTATPPKMTTSTMPKLHPTSSAEAMLQTTTSPSQRLNSEKVEVNPNKDADIAGEKPHMIPRPPVLTPVFIPGTDILVRGSNQDITINPMLSDETNLCNGKPVDGLTTLRNGTLVAFRGHYFWMLSPFNPPPPPRKITEVWGIPSPIDTVFTRCNCEGKTFFFKDSQYWRFTNGIKDPGYPKQIVKGFGGLNGKIVAALSIAKYKNRPESVYFFKRGGGIQQYIYKQEPIKKCPGRRPAINYSVYRETAQVRRRRFEHAIGPSQTHTIRIHYSPIRVSHQDKGFLHNEVKMSLQWRGFPSVVTSAIALPNIRKPDGYDYYAFSRNQYYNIDEPSRTARLITTRSGRSLSNVWYNCP
ncbi:proteoglycan 4 [Phoca vitulina]|uniref:proteoglycan 4 n=1 Tax=Phoca vitulina TaxID=9720 RepID=UPI0013962288|nr:proteoglycan 4 [Phoca vitulina]